MHETGEEQLDHKQDRGTEERGADRVRTGTFMKENRQTDSWTRETDTQTDGDSQEEGLEAVDHPPQVRLSVSRRAVFARTPSSSTTGIQLLSQVKL